MTMLFKMVKKKQPEVAVKMRSVQGSEKMPSVLKQNIRNYFYIIRRSPPDYIKFLF